jgi:hypothetical protein
MEPIKNQNDLYVAYSIHPDDPKREDRLRERIFNHSNIGVTVLPDSIGVRIIGWGREDGEAIMEGDTSISYHRTLSYPFERDDLQEAVDEMEEQVCGTGFCL